MSKEGDDQLLSRIPDSFIKLASSTDEIYPKKDVNIYLLQQLTESPNYHYHAIMMFMREIIDDYVKNEIPNIISGVTRGESDINIITLAFRTMLEMVHKLGQDFINANCYNETYLASQNDSVPIEYINSIINNLLGLTNKLSTVDPSFAKLFIDATYNVYSTILLCLEGTDVEIIQDHLERIILMLIILKRSLINYSNADFTMHSEWLRNRVELFF